MAADLRVPGGCWGESAAASCAGARERGTLFCGTWGRLTVSAGKRQGGGRLSCRALQGKDVELYDTGFH